MGLHHDGEQLGLSVFDAEMRRRIWWQIVVIDSAYATSSGLNHGILPHHWDTKEPSNLNDSDLYPAMTSIHLRPGPTEMIFCLVVFRLARIGINAPDIDEVFLQNEMGTADAPSNVRIEEARKRLDKIDQDTAELFNKYSERSFGPLHDFAIDFSHAMLKKMRDQACPIREQPEWGNEILTSGDNLFKISIISVEFTIYLYQKAKVAGNFVWISEIPGPPPLLRIFALIHLNSVVSYDQLPSQYFDFCTSIVPHCLTSLRCRPKIHANTNLFCYD